MSNMPDPIGSSAIARVEQLIRPHIRRTPIMEIDAADVGLAPRPLCLKLELFQHSGSFKARGAFANLLLRQAAPVGVVAASGGNHGVAVAYAARRLGVKAKIFVPSVSSPAKVARIRDYGADLAIEGDRYADALAASETWAVQTGALPVHAFDQNETMLGQGTLAMELEQQAPSLDTLLVAVGGGGLIAGIAAWYRGRLKVVGVEPRAAPTLTKALAAGRPVDAEAGGAGAGSLAPGRGVRWRRGASGSGCSRSSRRMSRTSCWSPTKRSCKRRRHCGGRYAWSRSRAAPRRSRRCSPARTTRKPAHASASSSAAGTRRQPTSPH